MMPSPPLQQRHAIHINGINILEWSLSSLSAEEEFLQHPAKVSNISFHSLFDVLNEGHLNYMSGSIIKLKWVVEVKTECKGSSFQVSDQITKLHHKNKSSLLKFLLTFTLRIEFIPFWTANILPCI